MKRIFLGILTFVVMILGVINIIIFAFANLEPVVNLNQISTEGWKLMYLASTIILGVTAVIGFALFFINLGGKFKFFSIMFISLLIFVIGAILCILSALYYASLVSPDSVSHINGKLIKIGQYTTQLLPPLILIPATAGLTISLKR